MMSDTLRRDTTRRRPGLSRFAAPGHVATALLALLLALPGRVLAAPPASQTQASTEEADRLRAALLSDLGDILHVSALSVTPTGREAGRRRFLVELEADLSELDADTAQRVPEIVRQLVATTLSERGHTLDAESRLRFRGGLGLDQELRGERSMTVVMFLPTRTEPVRVRLGPAAVRALSLGDIGPATTVIADALDLDPDHESTRLNTRQIFLRWKNLVKASPGATEDVVPEVLYIKWWGEVPARHGKTPVPEEAPKEGHPEDSRHGPLVAQVGLWFPEFNARLTTGGTNNPSGVARFDDPTVANLSLARGRLDLRLESIDFRAGAPGPFTFGGVLYNQGANLDLEILSAAGGYRLGTVRRGRRYLAGSATLRLLDLTARASATGATTELTGKVVAPGVRLEARHPLTRHLDVGLDLQAELLAVGSFDLERAHDLRGFVRFGVPGGLDGKPAWVDAGYRFRKLDAAEDAGSPRGKEIRSRFQGPYFAARLRF